ncbi:ribonuclease P protein component [Leeia sp. TBRC 13508]|uniref:Ribonuclease P protein component n=1 Tax=Leeia speluncae TaxID=2884804 RepID=A0ABS8D430_9NEIS|nr:ribonuclease P protein component [Leeia speluncae]
MFKPTGQHYRFPRCYRLTKTDEFSSVFGLRRSHHGHFFQLLYKSSTLSEPRLGVVVSKKVSKAANKRNYAKRLCREFFRLNRPQFAGFDIILRVKKQIERSDSLQARQELMNLSRRLKRV